MSDFEFGFAEGQTDFFMAVENVGTGATGPTGATGATGATGPAGASASKPKLLWSGTWSSGSITVDGISDYDLLVFVTDSDVPYVMKRSGSVVSGGGCGYAPLWSMAYAMALHCSLSEDTLTMNQHKYFAFSGYGGDTDIGIVTIIGIVRTDEIEEEQE